MLITHVRPNELWGKKVYDTDGRYLGAVVAIGSRRGVVRKVVVQRKPHAAPLRLLPSAETRLDGQKIVVPVSEPATAARLRIVR
jgi:sporulation protein YlmC with PRC-barrel domain